MTAIGVSSIGRKDMPCTIAESLVVAGCDAFVRVAAADTFLRLVRSRQRKPDKTKGEGITTATVMLHRGASKGYSHE